MKPTTTALITAASASSASAMAPFFNTTSTTPFHCPAPLGLFCAGPSLSQNLLIQCSMGQATPLNCIEHTASQAPIDDYNARCYETSPSSGAAACAKAGQVYPLSGNSYPLPAGVDDDLPEIPSLTASVGVQTTFAAPASLPPLPPYPMMPTEAPSVVAELSTLPKASLPAYVTTVTIGTQTRWHTVFSNCGNGTMLYGTGTAPATNTYAAWQTGSIPGQLPSSYLAQTSAAPNTIPCDPSSSSETSTVSWAITPTASTIESWAHPTNYATVPAATVTSFIWASGQTAAPSSSSNYSSSPTYSVISSAPSEYPSSTGNFDSGDAESSSAAARRGGQAPSWWVMAVVVAVVVGWDC